MGGVGVDGVGGILPFFVFFCFVFAFSFCFVVLRFSSFSSLFSASLTGQGETTGFFTLKMGNFTPTPSAPTPCKTSRN